MISSVMPSAKYSSSGVPRFSNGSTASLGGPAGASPGPPLSATTSGTAAPAAATATTPTVSARRIRTGATRDGTPSSGRLSASANSPAVWNRSAGTLCIAVRTARSTACGTALRTAASEWGASTACRAITARADGPVNGGWPASISYSTQPRL